MVSIDVPAFYQEWATRSGGVFDAAAGTGPDTLKDIRFAYREFFQDSFPAPDGVTFDTVDSDGVAAEPATPADAVPGRHLVHLHGGAYLVGDPQGYHGLVGELARRLRARALVPDYRLAPEAVFPAAVDDAVTAYRWLLDQGVAPENVVFAGDSAGGAMAVSVLVAARDLGLPMPAASIAISPWANLEHTGATLLTLNGTDPSVSREGLRRAADVFLGSAPQSSPPASPVFADPRGLPPVLIQIGGHEVMLSDAVRLAAKLAEDFRTHPPGRRPGDGPRMASARRPPARRGQGGRRRRRLRAGAPACRMSPAGRQGPGRRGPGPAAGRRARRGSPST